MRKEELRTYIENHESEMIEDLKSLIRIPSEKQAAEPGKPFGAPAAEALAQGIEILEKYGFAVTNYDNYAIAADFNQEEKGLDILAHLDVVPAGEGWQETDPFTPLIKEGKIRYWGISETTEEYLRRAHAVCPVTAIQNRYSMMARWHETIFQACEELGVTYVAFSPLANGFLSGAYTDKTQFEPGADFRSNMPQYLSLIHI
mgnify:CR=1 FL=1